MTWTRSDWCLNRNMRVMWLLLRKGLRGAYRVLDFGFRARAEGFSKLAQRQGTYGDRD